MPQLIECSETLRAAAALYSGVQSSGSCSTPFSSSMSKKVSVDSFATPICPPQNCPSAMPAVMVACELLNTVVLVKRPGAYSMPETVTFLPRK